MQKKIQKYLTLKEASKITPYQQEYLSLLCRRKQIKAIKINKKWHTTEKWLNAYLKVYKTDKLIENREQRTENKKYQEKNTRLFPYFAFVALTFILLISTYLITQTNKTQVAEQKFIPQERTILTEEDGTQVIHETGTRVLGVETEKEEQ